MISGRAPSWQLILADLALILFLVTLSALANEAAHESSDDPRSPADSADRQQIAPQIAASQALFRPTPLGPSIEEWLREQSADPRATLTIFAQHQAADEAAIWDQAQALASNAELAGFAVRVVITQGQDSDVYASLAYDAPVTVAAD